MERRLEHAPTVSAPAGDTKTLVKALWLVKAIGAARDGLSLTAASQTCGLPKATALRVLRALLESGMLRLDADGTYRLGAECLVLGTAFLDGLDLRKMAHPVVATVAEQAGETCHLGVPEADQVVYIDKVEAPNSVQMASRIGRINPLHSSAIGKAIIANSPPGRIESIIDAGLERRTERTITDPEKLRRQLKLIRERGYAIDDEENEVGIRCIAAPVFDHTGEAIAAISISGPAYRLSVNRLRKLSAILQTATRDLSTQLGRKDSRLLRATQEFRGITGSRLTFVDGPRPEP